MASPQYDQEARPSSAASRRGHNRFPSASSSISATSTSPAWPARTNVNPQSSADSLRGTASFDARRLAAWAEASAQANTPYPSEPYRSLRASDLARLDEEYEGEDGSGKRKKKRRSKHRDNGSYAMTAPTPPARRTSLSPVVDNAAQESYAMRQAEAEKLLGQAFGAPQKGNIKLGPEAYISPTPGGPDALQDLLAPLHRSFSSPSVHKASESHVGALNHMSSRGNSAAWGLYRTSGVGTGTRNSITASRTSLANPRKSQDPLRVPSADGSSLHPLRSPFRIQPRLGAGSSVESFVSAGLPQPNFHHLSPSSAATSIAGSRSGKRFDAGAWTFIDGDGIPDDQFAQGDRLVLQRVTSEPTAGPMIREFMESRVPTFAREPPHDMAEAVSRAGKILEEKRKSGVKASKGRDGRFWLTFFAVFVTAFLSAVDLTIISPILPTIAEEMPRSSISATWITSAFLATSASFQPLFGGLSDAIGRRESLLLAIVIFLVGSVVACVARDMLEIVIGRGVQGLGGGGMLVVGEIIISDMTTLAERGYFLGLLSISFAVAALAAPLAGGWFATFNWRVAFYINFPVGLVAILMLLPAKLAKPKLSLTEKIQRTDIVGSLILFGSITSLLIGLTNGGVQAPWASLQIAAPLGFGAAGLVLFLVLEFVPNPLARYPILPAKLFRHRTAAIAYFLTFLHGVLLYGATQGLVLYFENRGASPLKAAINILPANAPSTPAAFIAGIIMAITGKYRGQIIVCEGLMTLGIGLLIFLDLDSPTALWAVFQLIASFGLGALYSLTLPPIQATLPAHELAHATATFAFSRSFGAVWGVSAFLIAFQVQAGQRLSSLPAAAEAGITGGTAIDFIPIIGTLATELQRPLAQIFQDSIRVGFIVLTPFAGIGFIASFFMKHVPLPDFNDSKYGLQGQQLESAARNQPEITSKPPQKKKRSRNGLRTADTDAEKQDGDFDKEMETPPIPAFNSRSALAGFGQAAPNGSPPCAPSVAGDNKTWRSSSIAPSDTMQPSASTGSWLTRGLSLDFERGGEAKRNKKLEKQRVSLEQRRAALQKKSLDLERQYELLQAEIDRTQAQDAPPKLPSSLGGSETMSSSDAAGPVLRPRTPETSYSAVIRGLGVETPPPLPRNTHVISDTPGGATETTLEYSPRAL